MKKKIFIVAEAGNLHDGSLDLAKCLIKEAAQCGADAVKFQAHIFEAESLPNAPAPAYFQNESRKEYFERTAFTLDQWRKIKEYAQENKIEFMSSPFSLEAVDLLEEIGIERHKIPSGEVTNLPLLEKVASTKKPVLLSSGMSTWKELDRAVETLNSEGCKDITLMQCTSFYPCPPEKIGLNNIQKMKKRYGLKVGFSDHSMGISASIAAIALGAEVIEKHFTLSRRMYGSDAKHSMESKELKLFIKEIRDAEKALYIKVDKDVLAKEMKEMKKIFEKSIVAKKHILKGTSISIDDIAFKKPGDGIRADDYREILGNIVKVDIKKNTQLNKEMFE